MRERVGACLSGVPAWKRGSPAQHLFTWQPALAGKQEKEEEWEEEKQRECRKEGDECFENMRLGRD